MLISSLEWLLSSLLSRATIKAVGEDDAWEAAASASLRLHLGIGLAGGLLFMALAAPLAVLFGDPSLTANLRLYAVDVPLFGLAQAHANVLIARHRFRERARARALRWITRLFLIVVFVEAGLSVAGAILGCLGATLVETLAGRASVRVRLGSRGVALPLSRLWGYALPLFLSGLGLRILGLDLMVLKVLGGSASDAGLYGAALSLSIVASLLAIVVGPLLLATLVRLRAEGRPEDARRLGSDALRGCLLVVPFAAASLGARVDVVRLIFGSAFAGSAPLLVPLVAASLALFVVSVAIAILTAAGRMGLTAFITLPMPIVAICGYVLVVPRAGALGAAYVSAGTSLLGGIASVVAARRSAGVEAGWATCARAGAVSVLGWIAAASLPGSGLLVLPRLAACYAGCLAGLLVLGEWPREERLQLVSTLRSLA
jgi:O-antigen/teichoic acid export membrane protein